MKEVNKVLGEDALRMASDKSLVVKYISTGLLPFDIALPGGLPLGRITEVYGGPSSLKSYLGLKAIAQNQAAGLVCALIDTEHTFDPEWAAQCGVNLNELLLEQPDSGELALDTAETLARGGADLMVFDSIAAAQPQTERDKRLSGEKIQPGTHARMFSVGLRKLTAANRQTALLFINQTRMNIGITFGNPEVTPGGKAMPFYASLRMRIQHAGKVNEEYKIHDGETWTKARKQVAQKFRVTMEKSKLSVPYGEVSFIWSLKAGAIDLITFLFAQGVELGLVTNKGSLWTFKGVVERGRTAFLNRLAEDGDMRNALEAAVRDHYGLPAVSTPARAKRAAAAKPGASKPRRVVRRTVGK
jgi:recombination protein RecA